MPQLRFSHTITLRGGHIHRQSLAAARYPICLGQGDKRLFVGADELPTRARARE
jgi:hypothetical protein